MAQLAHFPFMTFVEAVVRQPALKIAGAFRDVHDMVLRAATLETDMHALATGIHQLRGVLAESGVLHQWHTLLNRTVLTARSPLLELQRETTFGWILLQHDKPALAEYSYCAAADQIAGLRAMRDESVPLPCLQQAEAEIVIGQMLLRADECATPEDVQDALQYWRRMPMQPDTEKRFQIALAALKSSAGMIEAALPNADAAYDYFSQRQMNAEAGWAAYYLGLYHADQLGIQMDYGEIHSEAGRWLAAAARHWHEISLGLGQRLIAPFLGRLDIELPAPRLSRLNHHLYPTASPLN